MATLPKCTLAPSRDYVHHNCTLSENQHCNTLQQTCLISGSEVNGVQFVLHNELVSVHKVQNQSELAGSLRVQYRSINNNIMSTFAISKEICH